MTICLTLISRNPIAQTAWLHELTRALSGLTDVVVRAESTQEPLGQLVLVDEALPDLQETLARIDRRGRAVLLIVNDRGDVVPAIPQTYLEGAVDDVLVHPFRPLEVVSKLRHYRQILMWDEVSKLNASFSTLIQGLREDLQLAENLQKKKVPVRFPDIRGLRVATRYLAGMRSGGDHFDLAEARDSNQLSMVLSDSSSYGLSSAVLSALMSVAVKLSADQIRSPQETVQRIYEEVALTLKEKDRLSLFYGVLNRKDFKLRYLNLGTSCAFYSGAGEGFRSLASQGAPVTKSDGPKSRGEVELELRPEDRLVLISDGFVEVLGGIEKTCELLDRFRKAEPVETVNELTYQVKSKLPEPDDLPEQDCTAVVFDVDPRVLRLAN